jgi:hypothetical protein
MRCLTVVTFLVLFGTTVWAKEEKISSGVGTTTCGKFAETYRNSPEAAEAIYFVWAQGFMTGRNSAYAMQKQDMRDLNAITPSEQQTWIRTYCDAHPLTYYFIAVLDLFQNLPSIPASKFSN